MLVVGWGKVLSIHTTISQKPITKAILFHIDALEKRVD
jgi:hypothetical protein